MTLLLIFFLQRLAWDAVNSRVIAVGVSSQNTSTQRVAIFRFDPRTAQLDCFGQSGNVLRRDLAGRGVVDAYVSDYWVGSRIVVATNNEMNLQILRYFASGPTSCRSVCGNGLLEDSESCDDGNRKSGDGCSPECATEAGFACPNPGFPCVLR
jgi:cysteine-rich repeat protein